MPEKILIVDDDVNALAALTRRLRNSYDVRLANGAESALRFLIEDGPFAAVVSDMHMPGVDGATLLRELRRLAPDTMRIMLTGCGKRETAVRAINDAAVFRFLTKPCNAGMLETALKDAVAEFDISVQRRKLEGDLRSLAYTDELTGLENRRRFFEHGHIEWRRARRYHGPLSVALFDVDHFKLVNDTLGHDAGDMVLRHVAHALKEGVRTDDMICRYGGEEFAALFLQADGAKAAEIAQRICNGVAARTASGELPMLCVTMSAGVATITDADATLSDLLARADGALYLAKRNGRNRVEMATGFAIPAGGGTA